jgi:hypothetical protein
VPLPAALRKGACVAVLKGFGAGLELRDWR